MTGGRRWAKASEVEAAVAFVFVLVLVLGVWAGE